MNRQPVTSSNLRAVGYDPASRCLECEFSSGSVYRYADVPAEVYAELLKAESKGRFLNARVKNRYEFILLPTTKPEDDRAEIKL